MEGQQATLAKVAEALLNPSGLQFSIDETPQVRAIQAALEELKAGLAQQQKAQEIQANALREGLMEIHEQRLALTTVECSMKEVKGQGVRAKAMLEKADEDSESLAIEPQTSVEGHAPFPSAAEASELQAWIMTELNILRSEVTEAERAARTRELAELRAVVEVPGTKA